MPTDTLQSDRVMTFATDSHATEAATFRNMALQSPCSAACFASLLRYPLGTEADRLAVQKYVDDFRAIGALIEHSTIGAIESEDHAARQEFHADPTNAEKFFKMVDLTADKRQRQIANRKAIFEANNAQLALTAKLLDGGALHRLYADASGHLSTLISDRHASDKAECNALGLSYFPGPVVSAFEKTAAGLANIFANAEKHRQNATEISRILLNVQ